MSINIKQGLAYGTKFDSRTAPKFVLRYTSHELQEKLHRSARVNNRSVNMELNYLLSKALGVELVEGDTVESGGIKPGIIFTRGMIFKHVKAGRIVEFQSISVDQDVMYVNVTATIGSEMSVVTERWPISVFRREYVPITF